MRSGETTKMMTRLRDVDPIGTAQTVGIVGGTGFIGTRITRAFEKAGWNTKVFTLESPVLRADGAVSQVVEDLDVLVWSASRNTPATAAADPQSARDEYSEVAATLDAVKKIQPHIHGAFMSSGGTVYGDSERSHREDELLVPDSPYACLKVDLENLFIEALESSTVLRVANAYGPGQGGQNAQGVLAHWLPAILRGEPVSVFGNPHAARDYVYVDDIAEAVVQAVTVGQLELGKNTFNIGSGHATSLESLLSIVREVTARDIEVSYQAGRNFDLSTSCLDITAITDRTDWHPRTDLATGIDAMWDWIVQTIPLDLEIHG